MSAQRLHARLEGAVQGVGFRPFVHRLASELGVGGWVLNDSRGVVLEVEAEEPALTEFMARLAADAPPLARIDSVRTRPVGPRGESAFAIRQSVEGGPAPAAVPPDAATCDECLGEIFDPADRRFGYAFTNCTNCGPRFTIVERIPFDRANTTMAGFAMCEDCRSEYEDPADRRFHAQANACPRCGPRLRLVAPGGDAEDGVPGNASADPLRAAADALARGAIVALKGIGGYHLACRATDEDAVARLRSRKHREAKPFALMARDLDAVRTLAEVGELDAALLRSPARPIVLLPRRAGAVAPSVAPRSRELGVMLPYSPLHHLLVAAVDGPLVMTSGNLSDEPIAFGDADALERLAPVADVFLAHDRPIRTRTDDSVARTLGGRAQLLRRSRGYVPAPLTLPVPAARPVLGCGAELKNTFTLAAGARAWVGHHVGDLSNWETLRSYEDGVRHLRGLLALEPEVVAHDLHPDYLSTEYARSLEHVELVGVQHHHAHLAACLAEHGLPGPAVGAIYDGTGLGTDGAIWGGEILVGDLTGCERAAHLWPVPMPGGEAAVREPRRMAAAWLEAAGAPVPAAWAGADAPVAAARRSPAAGPAASWPLTTSAGRLFDAVAAICGFAGRTAYEGQAAIELEAACDDGERGAYPLPVTDGAAVLDARPAVAAAAADMAGGVGAARVAARFHAGLARATAEACAAQAEAHGIPDVVLAGGVFANRRLTEDVRARLEAAGLRVLLSERLPPGDGAISYGQAAVAAARGA